MQRGRKADALARKNSARPSARPTTHEIVRRANIDHDMPPPSWHGGNGIVAAPEDPEDGPFILQIMEKPATGNATASD